MLLGRKILWHTQKLQKQQRFPVLGVHSNLPCLCFHNCGFNDGRLKIFGKKYPSVTEHIQICFFLPERRSARLICRDFYTSVGVVGNGEKV